MSDPIHQEVTFNASPRQVYEALIVAARHSAFTGAPAEISGEVGGSFSCHDGQGGRHIELHPDKRIGQAWRIAAWDDGVYSVVKIELTPEGDKTRLIMDHSGVPADAREAIEAGWKMRYWEPLEKYLAA